MDELQKDLMRIELTELLENNETVSKTHLVHAKHLAKNKYSSNITQDKEDVMLFQQLQSLYDEQNYQEPEVPTYTINDVEQAKAEVGNAYKLGEEAHLQAVAKYTAIKSAFAIQEKQKEKLNQKAPERVSQEELNTAKEKYLSFNTEDNLVRLLALQKKYSEYNRYLQEKGE